MKSREQKIAYLLALVMTGWGGYMAVSRLIVEPRSRLSAEITDETGRLQVLREMAEQLPSKKAEWSKLTATTLSGDASVVETRFKNDLQNLISDAGMSFDQMGKAQFRRHPVCETTNIGEVAVKVSMCGQMTQLKDFLKAFYTRPYGPGVRSMSLTARQSPEDVAAGVDPVLDIQFEAVAPVLPKVLDIESLPYDPSLASDFRLERRDFALYDALEKENVFRHYVESRGIENEPIEVVDAVEPVEVGVEEPIVLRPDMTIVGVDSWDGAQYVYVRDNEYPQASAKRYVVGQAFDDGVLEFVHPRGVVVRVDSAADESEAVNYYYGVGMNFEDREVLSSMLHGDVFAAFVRD